MYEEVYATYISPKHILVPCDCSKGFHKFGSCNDTDTNRYEYRGTYGHGCDKYTDLKIQIGPNTIRCKSIPCGN
eukprot:SAG31_NODE_23212_length_509_cov_0.402439_1_plen_73_part_10